MYFEWTAFFYYLMFVPLLIWAGILAWNWFKMPEFAGEVYDSNVEKDLISAKIPRAEYIQSYLIAERPRLGVYRCALALLSLFLLPILISFFYGITTALNEWSDANPLKLGRFHLTGILGDFVTFLLVMGTYVGMLWAMTALYYRNPSPSLRSQLNQLKDKYE